MHVTLHGNGRARGIWALWKLQGFTLAILMLEEYGLFGNSGIAPHRREAALPVPLVTGKLLESSPRVAGVRVAVAVLVRRWSGSVSGTRTRGSRQVKKGCPFSRHLRTVAAC
ncbi:hypothetical protein MRB53_025977 [Persea americana]|uniref:Uncharacterized protein n=1 Tax=Persea americana TaxID=3435 RepID=A0ACC2LGT7_PERAE|nr:hypothetical protein MRB53_025977 [Persea americana]